MDELEELDELDSPIEAFKELKESNVDDVIKALQNQTVLDLAQNDEGVKKQLDENAKAIINSHTDKLKTEAEQANQEAQFTKNKASYELYGVEKTCPKWQMKLMNIGAAIWFVIYWVIAFFTVVPINTFASMIGNIIHKKWKIIFLTILFYVIILGLVVLTPIIISLTKGV